ncbi:sigma-70 family RNA polymerase sigma factor [Actinoalloteichus hymeniacidonis]|uniref:RNA polymerase sigma factor n=1 Tax=Actinoalloteichus hymeniacidonis TaxID=340345 RepID=A0AAC9MYJ6_9PSEU|nr:sigma-70 family RNA polymerase sigma factor [Actinoalloteichus hymeniacidonis]AOS64423.1 RNA polymerase sigma-70 factor, TIGR02960 family [Actinoalloteichus hymeniacidonis]MBB5907509.1 RNA polymerase sigma-70 factor (ECF subfamily) [Actinoalloteichus hymeniacidonis]
MTIQLEDPACDHPEPDLLSRIEPYRRELLAHCYRMLGSVHDAEDIVQETYLRAWRAQDGFEGRSSLRTWLYRIATRVCLTALEQRNRRPLPVGLDNRPADPAETLISSPEVPWLEPIPDAASVEYADPAAIVGARADIRLAFVAALQFLPPRQRAVLLLRDVLCWRAAEAADLLECTVAAVNSSLQRARARLAALDLHAEAELVLSDEDQRAVLDRYIAAFEAKDVPAIVDLLTAEVVWEMPPFAAWYRGPEDVARHLSLRCPGGPGEFRLLLTRANGSPSVALYRWDPAVGRHRPFALQALTIAATGIDHVVTFFDLRLFDVFGLPAEPPTSAETEPYPV